MRLLARHARGRAWGRRFPRAGRRSLLLRLAALAVVSGVAAGYAVAPTARAAVAAVPPAVERPPAPAGAFPLLGAASGPATASVVRQDLSEEATLETIRPTVEWSPAGTSDWRPVDGRQTIRAGDRLRTGPGAAARLVFFEGTATELGPETGLLVQRLERTPRGNIVSSLFQSVGTTIHRVVQFVDPAASFEVETGAATAFVRGTTERIEVTPNGVTRVGNLPDTPAPGGLPTATPPALLPVAPAPTR